MRDWTEREAAGNASRWPLPVPLSPAMGFLVPTGLLVLLSLSSLAVFTGSAVLFWAIVTLSHWDAASPMSHSKFLGYSDYPSSGLVPSLTILRCVCEGREEAG